MAENLDLDIVPSINEALALDAAMAAVAGDSDNINFSWTDSAWEAGFKELMEDTNATSFPTGELIIAKNNTNSDFSKESFTLAWKFRIQTLNNNGTDQTIYVNTNTGTIIKIDNNSCNLASLKFNYGTQYIDTEWRGGFRQNFILNTTDLSTRRIHTKKAMYERDRHGNLNLIGFSTDDRANYKNNNGTWGQDKENGTTTHWAATKAWDYFSNTFNRISTNNGNKIRIWAEVGQYQGAAWRKYDDMMIVGFSTIYSPGNYLSSLDIIGHEFAHGIVHHSTGGHTTGGLAATGQSGALHESFADIFGYEVERYVNGGNHTNWTIGEDPNYLVRNLSNPLSFGQSAFYGDANWINTTNCTPSVGNDYCGIHINSGVQNYWFYLLSTGSIGAPNGTFNNIVVNGIGADKARNITYHGLENYLPQDADYFDARLASGEAAFDIYGSCSNELVQTVNAWAAVGLKDPWKPVTISGSGLIILNPTNSPVGGYPIKFRAQNGYGGLGYSWAFNGAWTNNITTEAPATALGNVFNISNLNGNYSQKTLSVTDGCGNTASKNITVILSGPNLPQLQLSPNPIIGSGSVAVSAKFYDSNSPGVPLVVSIFDDQGNLKHEQSFRQESFNIDVSNLLPGTYYLRAQQGDNQQAVHFVKQ